MEPRRTARERVMKEGGQPQGGQGTSSGLRASAAALLIGLLAAPAYAAFVASSWIDWRVLLGGYSFASVFSFLAYRSDKRRAGAGTWRISEFTLHLADMLGGWPGGFIAQRTFRHKTSKGSFQFIFWLIILSHQFLAIDSTLGWTLTSQAYRFLRNL